MLGRTISEIHVGDTAQFEKTFSESDVYLFAGITGDLNPAHINEPFASQSIFKGRVVHGMLTAGLVSAVLGMQLPGPGSVYLGQEMRFTAPVRIGDTVRAKVEVVEKNEEKNRVVLKTTCENQNGVIVLEGTARVMPPK